MAVNLAQPPRLEGWVVYGGHRPSGGPAYMLLPPEGGLFPTPDAAKARANEIAATSDWWLQPVFQERNP